MLGKPPLAREFSSNWKRFSLHWTFQFNNQVFLTHELNVRDRNLTSLAMRVSRCPPLILIFANYVQNFTFFERQVVLVLKIHNQQFYKSSVKIACKFSNLRFHQNQTFQSLFQLSSELDAWVALCRDSEACKMQAAREGPEKTGRLFGTQSDRLVGFYWWCSGWLLCPLYEDDCKTKKQARWVICGNNQRDEERWLLPNAQNIIA